MPLINPLFSMSLINQRFSITLTFHPVYITGTYEASDLWVRCNIRVAVQKWNCWRDLRWMTRLQSTLAFRNTDFLQHLVFCTITKGHNYCTLCYMDSPRFLQHFNFRNTALSNNAFAKTQGRLYILLNHYIAYRQDCTQWYWGRQWRVAKRSGSQCRDERLTYYIL